MSAGAGVVLKSTPGCNWPKVEALQACEQPLTWESSVSFGSLRASVAYTPSGPCASHESLLTSRPFKTSRILRTHMPGKGLQPPREEDPFVWAVTFFSRETEHSRPALGPGVSTPSFGPWVS